MFDGLDAGSVFVRLFGVVDEGGFNKFNREIAMAKIAAAKGATAKLDVDADWTQFSRWKQSIKEIDRDSAAFAKAEEARSKQRAQAEKLAGDQKVLQWKNNARQYDLSQKAEQRVHQEGLKTRRRAEDLYVAETARSEAARAASEARIAQAEERLEEQRRQNERRLDEEETREKIRRAHEYQAVQEDLRQQEIRADAQRVREEERTQQQVLRLKEARVREEGRLYDRALAEDRRREVARHRIDTGVGRKADFNLLNPGALRAFSRDADKANLSSVLLGKSLSILPKNLFAIQTRIPLVGWGVMIGGISALIPLITSLASSLGPIVGLLGALPGLVLTTGTAFLTLTLGLKGIGAALSTAWTAQNSALANSAKSADRAGDALKGVADAERGVADAERSAKQAQEDLNQAREDAADRVRDMRIEVEHAALAEKGAHLSLTEAYQELGRVEEDSTSTSLDLAKARLAVQEAEQGLGDSRRDTAQKSKELHEAEKQGVNRMPEVVSARKSLADAERGVADATRAVGAAQRNASRINETLSASTDQLATKMAALSPAGRQFVNFVRRELFPAFRNLQKVAQEGLLPGVEKGTRAAMANMPVLTKVVSLYSVALGDAVEKQGEFLGKKSTGNDLWLILKNGEGLIRKVTDALIIFEGGLFDVGVAARPLVTWLGDISVKLAKMFAQWAESGRESGKLEEFFKRSIKNTELFVSALWHFSLGLIRIGTIARRVWGQDMLEGIDDAAKRFDDWTKSVRGSKDIENYFERWRERWHDIAGAVNGVISRYRELRNEGKSVTQALITVMADALAKATVLFIANLGKSIPTMIAALAKAWWGSDLWGKLFLPVALISKFGGLAAWALIGRKLGLSLGAGVTEGVAASSVGTGAAAVGAGTVAGKVAYSGTGAAVGGAAGGVAAKAGVGAIARKAGLLGLGISVISGASAAFGEKSQQASFSGKVSNFVRGALGLGAKDYEKEGEKISQAILRGVDKGRRRKLPDNSLASAASRRAGQDGFDDTESKFNDQTRKRLAQLRKFREQAEKIFGKHVVLQPDIETKNLGKDLDKIESYFRRLKKGSDISLKQLQETTENNMKLISRNLDLHTKEGSEAVIRNFEGGMRGVRRLLKDGVINTDQAGKEIARLLKVHSGAGKTALGANFNAAERTIARTMRNSEGITKKGMEMIRSLMADEMRTYGFTEEQIRRSMNLTPKGERRDPLTGKSPETLGGHARGGMLGRARGFIGRMGERGDDRVHAVLGRGEAVLNFAQQRIVNAALGAVGVKGLPDLFNKTRGTRHHLATGGIAGMATGGIAGMTAAANKLEHAHFPYVWGGGHQASPAPFGPMDCSGAVSYVLQHGGVKIPTMVSGALATVGAPGPGKVTVFANDGHTFMRIGGRYFGTSGSNPGGGAGWMPDPGGAYRSGFVQRHFEGLMGRLGIPRVNVSGRGPLHSVVQGGLDKVRRSANIRLDKLAATTFGGGDFGDPGPGDGDNAANRRLGQKMAENFAGWGHGAEWGALDDLWGRLEGSWDENLANMEGSGAYGIAQALPASKYPAAGEPSAPAGFRKAAAQIGWGLNYIQGRYNDPIGAHAARISQGWYEGGGFAGLPFVGSFAGGGYVGGGGMLTKKGTKFRGTANTVISGLEHDIEGLGNRYNLDSQWADLSEEEFINEGTETTPPSLNQKAIDQRLNELRKLIDTRDKITHKYQRMIRYMEKLMKVYHTMRRRLGHTIDGIKDHLHKLKGRKGKEANRSRNALTKRLGIYRGTLQGVNEDIEELAPRLDSARFDEESSRIDRAELKNEAAPLKGHGAGLTLPDWEPAGLTEDQTAIADQQRARADSLSSQLQSVTAALQTFASSGDLGQLGSTAQAAVISPTGTAGLGYVVGPGGTLIPVVAGSGTQAPAGGGYAGGGTSSVTNNYFTSTVPYTREQAAMVAGMTTSGIEGQSPTISPRISYNL